MQVEQVIKQESYVRSKRLTVYMKQFANIPLLTAPQELLGHSPAQHLLDYHKHHRLDLDYDELCYFTLRRYHFLPCHPRTMGVQEAPRARAPATTIPAFAGVVPDRNSSRI